MRMLRTREVVEITRLSRMTIYRMERAGRFPARRQLGSHSVAWIESEVHAWLESRPKPAIRQVRSGDVPHVSFDHREHRFVPRRSRLARTVVNRAKLMHRVNHEQSDLPLFDDGDKRES